MKFEDIASFYNANIKGKPVAVGISGKNETFNQETLKSLGKAVKIDRKTLYRN
jgi:hypothetical protein